METRINPLLEALWKDILAALNNDQEGIDLEKIEELLKTHSRYLITELGRQNVPSLPPAIVDNFSKYLLPQGIDPLIKGILSYLRTERIKDSIYLDPLNTIKLTTQNLKTLLETIAQDEARVENLAWLQYKLYLEATTAWQEVIKGIYKKTKLKLIHNSAYHLTQTGRKSWQHCLAELKQKAAELLKLREQFLDSSDNLPAIFFSTTMEQWKERLWFEPHEETYWTTLWNKRENPNPQLSTYSSLFMGGISKGKKLLASTLNYLGIEKGTRKLKTDKQVITELLTHHFTCYQEAIRDCETLIAINQAKSLIFTKNDMLTAQVQQLQQLETYLNSVIYSLEFYAENQNKLDDNSISFFLKLKSWLGFRKAREERTSTVELTNKKAQAFTHVSNSTINILNAVKTLKEAPSNNWTNIQFQALKKHLDTLHHTVTEENNKLTTAFNVHNEAFHQEWQFWPRKTVLMALFDSISQTCPVGPKMR